MAKPVFGSRDKSNIIPTVSSGKKTTKNKKVKNRPLTKSKKNKIKKQS
jgi:hypothetical protein